jgi:hypothetical protein
MRMRAVMIAAALGMAGIAAAQSGQAPGPKGGAPAAGQQQAPPKPAAPTVEVANTLGFTIQKGTEQGLEVEQAGSGWAVKDGEAKYKKEELSKPGLDRKLMINKFSTADDTVVVKINMSPSDRPAAFVKTVEGADRKKTPELVDTKGRKYPAVGFIYRDDSLAWVRFTKGDPIKGLGAPGMPTVSRTTPDRKLWLVYAVKMGVEIKEMKIGDQVIETYDPPLKCDQKQK